MSAPHFAMLSKFDPLLSFPVSRKRVDNTRKRSVAERGHRALDFEERNKLQLSPGVLVGRRASRSVSVLRYSRNRDTRRVKRFPIHSEWRDVLRDLDPRAEVRIRHRCADWPVRTDPAWAVSAAGKPAPRRLPNRNAPRNAAATSGAQCHADLNFAGRPAELITCKITC